MPLLAALFEDWSLTTIYIGCAAFGGVTVLLQLILGVLGLGGDELDAVDALDAGDALDSFEGHDSGMHLFSLRAVAGFIVIFGLIGWGGTNAGWPSGVTLAIAFLAGFSTLLLIAWLLSLQSKLDSSGNLKPSEAVGAAARVYLRIPEQESGHGKITVELGGRTAEFEAFTRGAEIPTGAQVRILAMPTPEVFEVQPLSSSDR